MANGERMKGLGPNHRTRHAARQCLPSPCGGISRAAEIAASCNLDLYTRIAPGRRRSLARLGARRSRGCWARLRPAHPCGRSDNLLPTGTTATAAIRRRTNASQIDAPRRAGTTSGVRTTGHPMANRLTPANPDWRGLSTVVMCASIGRDIASNYYLGLDRNHLAGGAPITGVLV
jgi:hypothetical protein